MTRLCMILLLVVPLAGQDVEEPFPYDESNPAAGLWVGDVDAAGTPARVQFQIRGDTPDALEGTATIGWLMALGTELTSLESTERKLSFEQVAVLVPFVGFVLVYWKRHTWTFLKSQKFAWQTVKGRERPTK